MSHYSMGSLLTSSVTEQLKTATVLILKLGLHDAHWPVREKKHIVGVEK